jgi:hypothetical protein
MSTSKTSLISQVAILEEIVSDAETFFTWEQSLDIEDVIRSLDEADEDSISKHFSELLDSLRLSDNGYSSYSDILKALTG